MSHLTTERQSGAASPGDEPAGGPSSGTVPAPARAVEPTSSGRPASGSAHGPAVDSTVVVGDRPWRRAFLTGLSVWAAAQLGYFVINALFWTVKNDGGPKVGGALEVWDRWDTGHYVTIALTGYNPLTENPAFFPLYPMLMRILEPVLPGGMLSAGLIIAWAACVAALTVIYRLTDDMLGSAAAQRTAIFLMAFPFAFYLVAAYNQSLFIALSVASLYCMRKGHWWLAGAWAGLASGTRQAGIFLAIAFVIEYLRQRDWQPRRIQWNAAAIALVPSGLLVFAAYSLYALGDPLKFLHIQSFWGRSARVPWDGTVRTIQQIVESSSDGAIFQPVVVLDVIDLLSVPVTIALLVLSLVGPWKLGQDAWYLIASAGASFLMVLVSPLGNGFPPLHGVPRYVLEILPAFMVMARMGMNRYAERLYVPAAIAAQSAFVLAYFNNIWLS